MTKQPLDDDLPEEWNPKKIMEAAAEPLYIHDPKGPLIWLADLECGHTVVCVFEVKPGQMLQCGVCLDNLRKRIQNKEQNWRGNHRSR